MSKLVLLLLCLSANCFGLCEKVLPPDSVGKDAFIPNFDHISEGMSKDEVIRIFCREPDHMLEEGNILGWAFDLSVQQKVFDVQLKFDEQGKYLGHTDEGLKVVIHPNEE